MYVSRQDKLNAPKTDCGQPETPGDDGPMQIDLRLGLDEVAASEEAELNRTPRRRPTKKELVRLACRLYESRRQRWRIFRDELFGEPAWDMLLALYCLPDRGLILNVSSLSHAAAIPETTGLRWQATLIAEGLMERGPHSKDARAHLVRLTDQGRLLMEKYLLRLHQCDMKHAAEFDVEMD